MHAFNEQSSSPRGGKSVACTQAVLKLSDSFVMLLLVDDDVMAAASARLSTHP